MDDLSFDFYQRMRNDVKYVYIACPRYWTLATLVLILLISKGNIFFSIFACSYHVSDGIYGTGQLTQKVISGGGSANEKLLRNGVMSNW